MPHPSLRGELHRGLLLEFAEGMVFVEESAAQAAVPPNLEVHDGIRRADRLVFHLFLREEARWMVLLRDSLRV